MTDPPPARHLSRAGLQEYLNGSAPATIVVPGEPSCRIVFDPAHREICLRTPRGAGALPDLADFANADARVLYEHGSVWYELTIRYDEHAYEAYLLAGDITDMIQYNGLPFDTAVLAALRLFQDLLARPGALSAEAEAGLYGELLFLESCLAVMPAPDAVAAWLGHESSEHDFALPGVCFEVKTTRTERRRHRISGLDQLRPLPGVPLWLVSIQVTAAGSGAGRTLGELVDTVRAAAAPVVQTVDACLARAGWRERDRGVYRQRLTLRSTPTAYRVDDGFPVLDRRVVERASPGPDLITDVVYTIDITTLKPGTPPAPADRFVEGDA
jgi:hypothetical protein